MSYIANQGDVVLLDFDPSAGTEIQKRRPALVLSKKAFNETTGFSIVAPITSTVRGLGVEVVLPSTLKTQGAVLIYQMRSLDHKSRRIEFVEHAGTSIVKKACQIAQLIVRE